MEAAPAFVSTSVVTSLQLSRASGLVVVVVGLLVLVGWTWDTALKSVRLS